MTRDKFKDKSYFDDRVKFREECIAEDIEEIEVEDDAGLKMRLADGIVNDIRSLLESKYSRGDDVANLIDDCKLLVEYREKQKEFADQLPPERQDERIQWEEFSLSSLNETYKSLCFILANDATRTDAIRYLELVNYYGKDKLLDNIIHSITGNDTLKSNELLSKTFLGAMQVLEADKSNAAELMLSYLNSWYDELKVRGGYELHIKGKNTYTGYWCYEAALITRLYHIDDSIYRNHDFYPKDLA
ncbi:MAG: PoNe immunity protein domain-containing protein [Pseudomonadota bacterium]|uniref:Uncharacterized protein DUF1910 n=1 Tax=Gallaecimonas pentaromativorans TaxID=584787 RepID=A0A3N1PLT9_9GAMM|nr:PoNe immunity protein domain-containing protein [Gallaecimonas pentaromativorans]MED5524837.1 PoNe immunity protein domain-containing protein [Pseudomonadota bacterium]ROQ28848.1 uncharacterized protein DUF1910 [Gallaecimonas pentaromativorans]